MVLQLRWWQVSRLDRHPVAKLCLCSIFSEKWRKLRMFYQSRAGSAFLYPLFTKREISNSNFDCSTVWTRIGERITLQYRMPTSNKLLPVIPNKSIVRNKIIQGHEPSFPSVMWSPGFPAKSNYLLDIPRFTQVLPICQHRRSEKYENLRVKKYQNIQ